MAGATLTTAASAVIIAKQPGLTKTFYEGTPFTRLAGMPKPNTGGDSLDWTLNYAGNAGFELNEGDALPELGYQSYGDLTVAQFTIANTWGVSEQLQAGQSAGYFNAVSKEMEGCVTGLKHKLEEKLITLIEAAINDDATYAGQTRTTVHSDSDVTAGGTAALTLAMLSEMYETAEIDPRAVEYNPGDDIIISNPVQKTAYSEVAGATAYVGDDETVATGNRPYATNSVDAKLDAGMMKHSIEYNGLPWYSVATMTNTIILRIRLSDILFEEAAPLTMKPLAYVNLVEKHVMFWIGKFAYRDPYRASLIEALTT